MEKVLLAVDSSTSSLHAAEYLYKLVSSNSPMTIHVLNVQEPMLEHIATRFSEEERHNLYSASSDEAKKRVWVLERTWRAIHLAVCARGGCTDHRAESKRTGM